MNAVALLALLNALPAASGKNAASGSASASSGSAASGSAASAWRAALGGRSTAAASPAPAAPSTQTADPLTATIARAVASGTALSAIVDTAASALGTAIAAGVGDGVDPAPVTAAVKAVLDPPDPGGTASDPLDRRVRTLVARLRNVADAAARVSETTTGQQNRFPGNDLDAANAAKANPAPTTTTGTSDAAASEPLADRLLTVVCTAVAAETAASKSASTPSVASGTPVRYLDVRSHSSAASVTAPPAAAAALLGSYVDAVARTAPSAAASSASSVTVALALPSGTVSVRASVTVDADGTHAVLAVPDAVARDAVAARQASVVADLQRSGVDVTDIAVVVDPTIAATASATAHAAIAPAPAALRLAVANAAASAASEASSGAAVVPAAAANAAGGTKPQILTAASYRAPAASSPAAASPVPAGGRALPIVTDVRLPVAAPTAAPQPGAAVPVATDADAAPAPEALPAPAAGATATATALAPTVVDVATLAATSAPAAIAPPRDVVALVLTQAIAQAAARADAGVLPTQEAATGDSTAQDEAREQSDTGTNSALPPTTVATIVPAQAAAPAAPSAPADPYAIVDQLANAVVRTASGHAQTATELRVRLSPENLGELNVTVRVDGSSVTAQVTTHDAATHAVLATSGDGLAKTLAAAGLRLDGFTVSLAGGAPNDFGRGSAQPQQERGRGRKASFGTDADDVDPTSAVESGVPIAQRPGTLDERV